MKASIPLSQVNAALTDIANGNLFATLETTNGTIVIFGRQPKSKSYRMMIEGADYTLNCKVNDVRIVKNRNTLLLRVESAGGIVNFRIRE